MDPLRWAARNGPTVLVAGLVAGLLLPGVAQVLRPHLSALVVLLLFTSMLRIAPSQLLGSLQDLPGTAGTVFILQLALPLALALAGLVLGLANSPFLVSAVLMASAPSIVGSPNICMMMGRNPAPAMRLMVTGSTLLPLSVLPVFALLPALGGTGEILAAATKLLFTIVLTALCAMAIRRWLFPAPSIAATQRLDGLSAITLSVFVVGLMPAVTAAFRSDLPNALLWLGFVFVLNFGAQMIGFRLTRQRASADLATSIGVIAGNRNIALFLVALPEAVMAPLMVFVGCYQIPMYLTPILLRRVYSAD